MLYNVSCNLVLLSQGKKSECGIPQPSSGIAGDNVLKCGMPEPLPETRALTNWTHWKLDAEWKQDKHGWHNQKGKETHQTKPSLQNLANKTKLTKPHHTKLKSYTDSKLNINANILYFYENHKSTLAWCDSFLVPPPPCVIDLIVWLWIVMFVPYLTCFRWLMVWLFSQVRSLWLAGWEICHLHLCWYSWNSARIWLRRAEFLAQNLSSRGKNFI